MKTIQKTLAAIIVIFVALFNQAAAQDVDIFPKGDVITCAPGVEHWHASTPNSTFTYVAVSPSDNGKTIWKNRVTDAAYNAIKAPGNGVTNEEQEIKTLSKKKWDWMADKNVDSLTHLFHDKSMFVHMGGSWGKEQEINVIKSGGIWYKKAEVYSVVVNMFDNNTAILLNDIDLVAVVGGNEVVNPFMVTEVYIHENGKWKMGSLTFSRLMRPVKMNNDNSKQQ